MALTEAGRKYPEDQFIVVTRELLEQADPAFVSGRFRTWTIVGKRYRLLCRYDKHLMPHSYLARLVEL